MTSILETLQYLKSQQVLHRDLKPDNLLFKRSDSKEICIIDFGLAEIYDPIGKYIFKWCGTPGFVAPEILNDAKYDY